ncbi:MAG: hypothetical protein J6386_10785 [Candidatus Synoicihabitans palmerolidicus]|nr:hypothetical protein [Candidatus Synoicihabitans palmerolidicus]
MHNAEYARLPSGESMRSDGCPQSLRPRLEGVARNAGHFGLAIDRMHPAHALRGLFVRRKLYQSDGLTAKTHQPLVHQPTGTNLLLLSRKNPTDPPSLAVKLCTFFSETTRIAISGSAPNAS